MRRVAFLPPGFFKGLNKLTYWVGLPILLFVKIGAASLNLGPVMRLSGILISSILAITAIAVVLAYRLPMAPFSRGAFIQASFRGNQAFVGLPIIVYSLGAFPEVAAGRRGTGRMQGSRPNGANLRRFYEELSESTE